MLGLFGLCLTLDTFLFITTIYIICIIIKSISHLAYLHEVVVMILV